jgi:hypothetical protein
MLKKILRSKIIKINGAIILGGTIFTAQQYPELKKDPK